VTAIPNASGSPGMAGKDPSVRRTRPPIVPAFGRPTPPPDPPVEEAPEPDPTPGPSR
jgi:hypothetical protein